LFATYAGTSRNRPCPLPPTGFKSSLHIKPLISKAKWFRPFNFARRLKRHTQCTILHNFA
jgi:hypothetical protein